MASLVASRIQHISALAELSTNTTLPKPTGKDRKVRFVPVTSSSKNNKVKRTKYVPTREEENYQKVLSIAGCSIFLEAADAIIDSATTPPSPNMSKRGEKSDSPTTPPASMFRGEELVAICETGTTSSILNTDTVVTPVAPRSYKGSPLNKELPPKPVLRLKNSPERRGLLDAIDSDTYNINHPVLQPESSGGESPKSFKVASSLGSTPSTLNCEFGTGVTVEGEIVNLVPGLDLGKAKPINAVPVRSPKNGSPAERVHPLSSKPSEASLTRRAKYGLRPTIRKSADAHEIIMGLGSEASQHPPRTSSLPKHIMPVGSNFTTSTARLSRPTAASTARAAEAKKSMPTPSKNLGTKASTSKVSILSSTNKSVASNIASNKAGSSASGVSSLPKSNTVTSIRKGFKSRFSEMFSGRRRNTVSASNDAKSFATTFHEEKDIAADNSVESPVPINPGKRSSVLLTTYHNSGMNAKATSNHIRGDNSHYIGKMSDHERSAGEQRRHERDGERVSNATEIIGRGMTDRGVARGTARVNRGDEPPNPPPTSNGPAGHYGEGTGDHPSPENMTEAEFDRYLEHQLNEVEASLHVVIAAARDSGADGQGMARITDVIQAVGATIIVARQALIASIELRAATTNLVEYTASRFGTARDAIVEIARVLNP